MHFSAFLPVLLVLLLTVGCGRKAQTPGSPATLDELNRAVVVVSMRGGTFPPSTNDLAAFLALTGKRLTVAPPGKHLVFDPGTRGYVFRDQ